MTVKLPVLSAAAPDAQGPIPPAAPQARQARRLIDSHGRTIRDLRLSVTDRCNFRCVYCMDPEVRFLPKRQLLRAVELVRLARIAAGLGVEKIRLTGGEPLVYPELDQVIGGIAALGLEVALTTNGSLLDGARAEALRAAGLTRLTISIDSIHRERFAHITRSTSTPETVLQAISSAIAAGLGPVKVNAVAVRGLNEGELPALAALAREFDLEMRFIEFMPLDASRAWDPSRLIPASEILERIEARFPLIPGGRGSTGRGESDPSSTAAIYRFADGGPGRIGLIAPVTRPFCNQCTRLRITADGRVRPCLFSNQEWDVRPLLRQDADDRQIEDFLLDATWTKQAGHGILSKGFVQPARHMSAIGG
jgi:GTP 3',8-cyclase